MWLQSSLGPMLEILCELPMLLRVLHADQIKLRSARTGKSVTATDAAATECSHVVSHARFACTDATSTITSLRDFATATAARATRLGRAVCGAADVSAEPSAAAKAAGDDAF